MKTVYFDNNCYGRLLRDPGAFSLLLSLSHNRRGFFSFESSIITLFELALIWKRSRNAGLFLDLVRLARRLVRRDRVFRDVSDIIGQEVLKSTGAREHVSMWHGMGSANHRRWQWLLGAVCRGSVPGDILAEIESRKRDHVQFSEEIKQTMLKRVRVYETTYPGIRLSLEASILREADHHRRTHLVTAAQKKYPNLPRSEPEARTLVLQRLHALRMHVGLSCGFAVARIAGQVNCIDPGRSMKRQGRHKGGDYFDVRHATYGRYVDFFVTEERLLHIIVNSLGEMNYAGLPYRALSLAEFLTTARQLADG